MKRLMMLCFTATTAFLVACQDARLPGEPEGPNFAVRDGAHPFDAEDNPVGCKVGEDEPCEHFFFLPPLVPTPVTSGDFNQFLTPTVIVSEIPFGVDLNTDGTCVFEQTPVVVAFEGSEISVDAEKEQYSVGFQTGRFDLDTATVYRICVKITAPDPDVELGFRDIQPDDSGADIPRNPEQLPILQFNNGSNLPIKFRIEAGLFCDNDDDCGEASLGPGGVTFTTNTGNAGLGIPEDAVVDDVIVILERVPCPMTDGRVTFLPIDLPQFPFCYNMTTDPPLPEGGFEFPAVAGVCLDLDSETLAILKEGQEEELQIHHLRNDGIVEALPNVAAPFLPCDDSFVAASSNPIVQFARRGWRAVRRHMSPWFMPEPALARSDFGFGGDEFDGESPLVWALPAQFAIVSGTETGVGAVGSERIPPPEVVVTDVNGVAVQGATVAWKITQPTAGTLGSLDETGSTVPKCGAGAVEDCFPSGFFDGVRLVTDMNGKASIGWTLGDNPNTLQAFGRGIGCLSADECGFLENGFSVTPGEPPTLTQISTGPFAIHAGDKVFVGTGLLQFTAVACPAAPVINGVLDDDTWVAALANDDQSFPFTANLSKGDAEATLTVYNDCDNIYIGVTVARDIEDKVAILRVDFDNNGDDIPESGDDAILLEGVTGDGDVVFDRFLTAACLRGGKQAECGDDDDSDGGSNDVVGDWEFDATAGLSVYEIQHPLSSGDVGHDINRGFDDVVGLFVTLRQAPKAKGAQGNTQWPGFRLYLRCTIKRPGGTPTTVCVVPDIT